MRTSWAAVLAAAVIVVFGVVVYAAVAGGKDYHAGQATTTALFTGKAAVGQQQNTVRAVISCGKTTRTITHLSYSTPPFQVTAVTDGPALQGANATTAALARCLVSKLVVQGPSVALCPQQAAQAAGAGAASAPALVTDTVTCVSDAKG